MEDLNFFKKESLQLFISKSGKKNCILFILFYFLIFLTLKKKKTVCHLECCLIEF